MDYRQPIPIQTVVAECPHWVKVQEERQSWAFAGLNKGYIENPQQHFPLVITMQPDGTVITRAFCHKGHEYCKGCPYERGEWIDRPGQKA
jgi:hypothetical protein